MAFGRHKVGKDRSELGAARRSLRRRSRDGSPWDPGRPRIHGAEKFGAKKFWSEKFGAEKFGAEKFGTDLDAAYTTFMDEILHLKA